MRQSPFIWLGSGRTRKRDVARKGSLLDQAARSGLPVPAGGILLDVFYQICLSEGLVEVAGGALSVPDPEWLHEVLYQEVRFPKLVKPVAVRSAAADPAGDGRNNSLTRLNVDFKDPVQLAESLREMWSTMNHLDDGQPHDVLVMEMVKMQTEGKVLSAADSSGDEIDVLVRATGESLDGFTLKKIGTFQRASAGVPPFARRLQKLLRGVRRSFGKGDYHIDWVDDGQICWLLQIV